MEQSAATEIPSLNRIKSVMNLECVNHTNQVQPPVNQFNQALQQLAPFSYPHLHLIQQMQQQQQLHQFHQQQHQLQMQLNSHSHQRDHHRHQRNSNHNNHNNNNSNNNNNNINDSNTSNINSNGIAINGRQNHHHAPKKELIDLVTCKLCKGYLIDAATLDLCMHSFCRPCAVKFIREKPKCPECNLEIKDKRFLNRLKTDVTIQNIVYKLVPGLYEKEMARRRKFYAARPSQTPRYESEMFGDIPRSKTIKPDDLLNISITWNKDCVDEQIKTYLYCRADSNMLVLKKLIVRKFGLERPIKIYHGNSEIFFDLTTLMDVAATFNWAPENKILNLNFKEEEKSQVNSLPLTSSGHDL